LLPAASRPGLLCGELLCTSGALLRSGRALLRAEGLPSADLPSQDVLPDDLCPDVLRGRQVLCSGGALLHHAGALLRPGGL
jgi:hypothetical protein